MIKKASRRFLVLTLVLVLLMSLMPTGFAADGLTVDGLGAATSGGSWTLEDSSALGQLEVDGGCNGDTGSASLTLTNNKDTEAALTFKYEASATNGTVKINGNAVSGTGSFNEMVAAGGTVVVQLDGNAPKDGTASCMIKLSNINLVVDKQITVEFTAAQNGSYTVDGNAAPYTFAGSSLEGHAVKATAANGYRFFAWYNETAQKYVSSNANDTLFFTDNATIRPVFVSASLAFFQVGSTMFYDLNEAVAFAVSSGNSKVTVISDGTLPAGNYTIPNGITLLVPMDVAQTVVRDEPSVIYGEYATPTAYRTLAMASGANITIESGGAISLASKLSSKGQMGGYNGTPTGPDGRINMAAGSSITVKNGGNLYAWGYIYGSGSVTAESGATVHEAFQIKDWRGGSATTSVVGYAFIINQYYVQNIEVPLTLQAGATEKLYSAANASSSAYPMGATFVGNGGMFTLSSGYIVKDYIENTDRLQIDCYGNVAINPMTLTDTPAGNISTSNYNLPITSNITINVHSGSAASVSQNIELLPGTEVKIDDDATLNINSGKKIYVYDNDDWSLFTGNARLYVVGYSVANGTTAKRTAASLKDAEIIVNGTVNVNGSLFTSAGGAAITSEGNGSIILNAAPTEKTTIYECYNNKTKTAVEFTAAQLKNADGTYTQSKDYKSGDTIPYVGGKWGGDTVLITFVANDGTGVSAGQRAKISTDTPLDANAFTRSGYNFTGWNTAADGSGTAYADGATVNLAADVTLYAQWQCRHEQTELRGVVESTCTEPGYTGDTYCKTCGVKLADGSATEALGHAWDEGVITTAPTCEGAGVKTFTCSRCGETYTEAVDATGHTPKAVEKLEPTCTEPGHEAGEVCEVCGAVLSGMEEIPALGHTPVTDAAVAPTCTETGLTEGSHCSVCGEVLVAQETVPALGHTPVVDEAVAPTCTATGLTEGSHCAVCGEVLVAQEVVPALGHTPVTDPAVAPTCTETGLTEGSHCSVCGEVIVAQENVPAKGHTEEIRDAKAPTLTDPGYTGDKYCSVCGVLLEQGQVIPRTGAEVTWIVDGAETVVTLPIGEVPAYEGTPAKPETLTATYTFTGWTPEVTALTADGATYTAVFAENVKSGWISWEDSWYYIEDGAPVKGLAYVPYPSIPGRDYGPSAEEIAVKEQYGYPDEENSLFLFDEETGAFRMDDNGFYTAPDGQVYWLINGESKWHAGLVQDGDDYYYFRSDRVMAKDMDLYLSYPNGIVFPIDGRDVPAIQSKLYTFGPDGKLLKNLGIVEASNGGKYYYEDYHKALGAGVVKIGDDFYYVRGDASLVVGRDYWVSQTNGYVVEGSYRFDNDGRMVNPVVTKKDGIVSENGSLYYYKDGVLQCCAGVIEIDGAYYYVKSNGELVHDRSYWVTNHNNLLPERTYQFDSEGRIVDAPDPTVEPKDGIVSENGSLYYYKNDKLQANAGLIELDGKYYYVRSNGEVVHDRSYWTTNHNNLLPEGTYTFGADGAMVNPPADSTLKDGIVSENDGLFYYKDGKLQYGAGLVEIDGALYYIRSNGQAAIGKYWVTNTNNLCEQGEYFFGDDGKMIEV